jgi:hypothetical protein
MSLSSLIATAPYPTPRRVHDALHLPIGPPRRRLPIPALPVTHWSPRSPSPLAAHRLAAVPFSPRGAPLLCRRPPCSAPLAPAHRAPFCARGRGCSRAASPPATPRGTAAQMRASPTWARRGCRGWLGGRVRPSPPRPSPGPPTSRAPAPPMTTTPRGWWSGCWWHRRRCSCERIPAALLAAAPCRAPCRVPLHHRCTATSPSTAAGREDEPEWGHGPELHLLAHAESGRRATGRKDESKQGRGLELDFLTHAEREEERWVVGESVERRVQICNQSGRRWPGRGDPAGSGGGWRELYAAQERKEKERERKEKGESN